jgi:hypothetical protein
MFIQEYHHRIDKKLLENPNMLSRVYIEDFMKARGGLYSIPNIIEFVKHLKYASIYIFDPTGQFLIANHIAKNELVSANMNKNATDCDVIVPTKETVNEINEVFYEAGLIDGPPGSNPGSPGGICHTHVPNSMLLTPAYTKSVIGIINRTNGTPHLDIIREPNVKRSVAITGKLPPMFNVIYDIEDEYDFEYFNQPEELAFGNVDYNEFNAEGHLKNRKAKRIFFEGDSERVSSFLRKVAARHKQTIPEIIHDDSRIVGFQHPVTKQIFELTNDYYERKRACDVLYATKGFM